MHDNWMGPKQVKCHYRILALGLVLVGAAQADSVWEKTKEIAGSAAEIVGETASSVGKAVSGDKESPQVARAKIDQMADATLRRLLHEVPGAAAQFEASPAYAVFDTRRTSLLITAEYGQGVAINRNTGRRVYMKMATGGVNLGAGAQFYQVVFLFPSETSYNTLVTKGWDANAAADAVGGKDAEGASLRLPDGTRVYKFNEKGVMLTATLTGTKYWQADELNADLQ